MRPTVTEKCHQQCHETRQDREYGNAHGEEDPTEPLTGLSSYTDERKALDRLEVAAVVRADLELVTETGRGDQQVEITNRPSLLPESPPLTTEDPAHLIVNGDHRQPAEEPLQRGLAAGRVTRVVDALVQFGERDDAHSQAAWPQLVQSRRDNRDTVEMVDDPVGVDEVARPHRRAGGRLATRRSA